jgi:deoxycytidine triphosphate deaminase
MNMGTATKITSEQIHDLCENPVNEYLKMSAEDKYAEFKYNDPFPLIPDALLNSYDIVRYILTTGMIYPFCPERLEGAVYTCNFSGNYKYWDGGNISKEETLSNSGEFTLPPNSIVFLEVEPMFRVPTYLVLRFNLKVQHVYKGLLLGTGPIVDPGFVGKLYIPLHNLTSNEYIIKKGAPLICVEFTKLSKHTAMKQSRQQERITGKLDFSTIPIIHKVIEPSRDLNKYLKKAIVDPFFRKSNTKEISVGSSIPKAITQMEQNVMTAEKNARKAEKNVNKTKNLIKTAGIISLIATFLAIGALTLGIFSLIDSVNTRIDSIHSDYCKLTQEHEKIQKDNIDLRDTITDLRYRINNMQQTNKDNKTISKTTGGKNQ